MQQKKYFEFLSCVICKVYKKHLIFVYSEVPYNVFKKYSFFLVLKSRSDYQNLRLISSNKIFGSREISKHLALNIVLRPGQLSAILLAGETIIK